MKNVMTALIVATIFAAVSDLFLLQLIVEAAWMVLGMGLLAFLATPTSEVKEYEFR